MLKTIRRAVYMCENLVEIQNLFKTRQLRSVDIEMIKDIGLFNLESIGSTEVEMLNHLTRTTRKGPLQVVYEQNNNEGTVTEDITTMFQHETTTPSSQNQVVAGDVSASASRLLKNNKNKVGEYLICNHHKNRFEPKPRTSDIS
ncbi:hypothetical protein ACE6H2_016581 [Prunus campanulata]